MTFPTSGAPPGIGDVAGMPTKTRTSPQGEASRRRIAAGVIQRTSLAAIAREENISRQTIWKQAGANNVRQIVVAAVSGELERIGQRFARLLGVIAEAVATRMIRVGKDGTPVVLGPDHYARLTGADRFIKLLTAGRPPTVVSVIAAAAAIAM